MTDWWDWVRWGGTSLIAIGALTLGVRAEMRAARYRATFVINGDREGQATLANTTGEPAADVVVSRWPGGGEILYQSALMLDDEVARFDAGTPLGSGVLEVLHIQWTRPKDGQHYEQLGPVVDRRIRPFRRARDAYREGRLLKTSKGRKRDY